MANETIHLHFIEYDPALASAMLDVARRFAAAKPDGPPGWRRGSGYALGGRTLWAHWTAARVVVVRECQTNSPVGDVRLPIHRPDPGYRWADCCCREIDPADVPCVVCEASGGIGWVIVGGESGPSARPMHPWNPGDRVGKKAAGRLLDDAEHNDRPEAT